jgi:hypothetical protein
MAHDNSGMTNSARAHRQGLVTQGRSPWPCESTDGTVGKLGDRSGYGEQRDHHADGDERRCIELTGIGGAWDALETPEASCSSAARRRSALRETRMGDSSSPVDACRPVVAAGTSLEREPLVALRTSHAE